jgi:gamma-glutamylcyclotransferase
VRRADDSVLLFAYGPNLHPAWLRRRVPAAALVGPAELPGHRMAFRKRGRDGSGKSDACPSTDPGDRLPGVLYRLLGGDLQSLGAAGAGYRLVEVEVDGPDGTVAALTWRAEDADVAEGLVPWDWYLALIRAGAELHDLPGRYRAWLASVPVARDPDAARAEAARAILEQGG